MTSTTDRQAGRLAGSPTTGAQRLQAENISSKCFNFTCLFQTLKPLRKWLSWFAAFKGFLLPGFEIGKLIVPLKQIGITPLMNSYLNATSLKGSILSGIYSIAVIFVTSFRFKEGKCMFDMTSLQQKLHETVLFGMINDH